MKCPKCAYDRKPTDLAPDYECPSCGIIYAKYIPSVRVTTEPQMAALQSPSMFKRAVQTRVGNITAWVLGIATALFIITKIYGEYVAFLTALALLAIWVVGKAIEGSHKQEQERQAAFDQQPYHHCMTCGHDFKHDRTALRGNNTMEIGLWILLLWPIALIYSIWRRLGVGKAKIACLVCASNQVVPDTSPAAIAHKKSLGI